MKQFVYFISDGNFVKIGTTFDVQKRLSQLQTGNPNKLTILFIVDGDNKVEFFLHEYYQEYKINNEWFDLLSVNISKKEVINIIEANKIRILNKTRLFKKSLKINIESLNLLYKYKGASKDILFYIVSKMDENNEIYIDIFLKEEIKLNLNIGMDYINKTISILHKDGVFLKKNKNRRCLYIINKHLFNIEVR